MWPIEQLCIELGALPNVLKISSKIAFFPKIGVRYELLWEIELKPNDQSSEGCAGIYCPATEFSNESIDLWITVNLYAVEATALS